MGGTLDVTIAEEPHVVPAVAQSSGKRENRWHVPPTALANKRNNGAAVLGTTLFHASPPAHEIAIFVKGIRRGQLAFRQPHGAAVATLRACRRDRAGVDAVLARAISASHG
jgi:hypothetical protein